MFYKQYFFIFSILRLVGYKGVSGLYYLPALIKSQNLPNHKIKLRFYIDTGASVITISDTDAVKNKILYNLLYFDPQLIQGIGGTIRTRILSDCTISFLTDDDKVYHSKWNYLHIMDRGNIINAINNPLISLLGINFLQNFKISFRNDNIILEQ